MRPSRIALLAPLALAACAAGRSAPLPPRVVAVEACSASVALRLAPDPDDAPGAGLPRDAVTATFHGAGVATVPEGAVRLPGTVRLAWQDTVRQHGDDPPVRFPRAVRLTGVQVGHWSTGRPLERLEVDQEVAVRCGERAEHAVEIPRTRVLRVTSDPAGASIFARVRTGAYSDEERFLGTTPARVPLLWQPGQTSVTLRLERSGHAAVTRRVERRDDEVRIVLHPLPDRRP